MLLPDVWILSHFFAAVSFLSAVLKLSCGNAVQQQTNPINRNAVECKVSFILKFKNKSDVKRQMHYRALSAGSQRAS